MIQLKSGFLSNYFLTIGVGMLYNPDSNNLIDYKINNDIGKK